MSLGNALLCRRGMILGSSGSSGDLYWLCKALDSEEMFRKKSQKSCFQFHEVVISSSILIPEEGFQVKYSFCYFDQ